MLTQEICDHVAGIFENEGSDAWFIRPVNELMPAGLKCPDCGGQDFSREEDILDVWFDSGVSYAAVVEQDPRLGGRADLYLEGSDQHRGWFHTALLTSIATRDRAPYLSVLTHGFTLDGKGRKMSKSVGNTIAPQEICEKIRRRDFASVGLRRGLSRRRAHLRRDFESPGRGLPAGAQYRALS